MTINLVDPTCFTSAVFITDTVTNSLGTPETIPNFPTTIVDGIEVPISGAFVVQSTAGGIVNPSMTGAQINALPAPVNGMQIYNTNTNSLSIYQGGAWQSVEAGNGYGPGDPLFLSNPTGNSVGVTQGSVFTTTEEGNLVVGSNVTAGTLGSGNTVLGIGPNLPLNMGGASDNVVIGNQAFATSQGFSSVAVGSQALQSLGNAQFGVAVGYQALQVCQATANTAIGYTAGVSLESGNNNVFIGTQVGYEVYVSGADSVGIGYQSLYSSNTSGSVAIGSQTLQNLISAGFAATAIGTNALKLTNTNANTAVGYNAGAQMNGGGGFNTFIGNTTGFNQQDYTNCTFLGSGADGDANGLINSTAIGYNTAIGVSNGMNLGNGCVIGINNANPVLNLDINNIVIPTLGFPIAAINLAVTAQVTDSGSAAALGGLIKNLYAPTLQGALVVGTNGHLYYMYNGTVFQLDQTPFIVT